MSQPELDFASGRTRTPDHETSEEGARSIAYRAGSQKARLLDAYTVGECTDEEAAGWAGLLGACYWKRCNELRQDGKIIPTGETRTGRAGVQRMVCRLA
jgi:hypothetical protein